VKVDPLARLAAQSTTEWRLEIWKAALPLVPQYLIKGKGYTFDPRDLYLGFESASGSSGNVYYGTIVAGDYHNGPLSVVIPFGILGVITFTWFLVASIRAMNYYCKFGNPDLLIPNRFLLAAFIAKIILFVTVFGAFYSDLATFTGLIGLAVSLNGPQEELAVEEPVEEEVPEAAFEGLR
jgi:hypothetical protein